jgi:hypothetical protein
MPWLAEHQAFQHARRSQAAVCFSRMGSELMGRSYLPMVYSISVWPSFTPAFGSAVFTVRTIP